ncbi:MAG TPA: cytochrome P450 [Sphingobium sp.]|uniref:cytochrome P450 n=1 Tax=Sphingobium sp. TaxID=1912891 RepID=UPI002ED2BE9C
MAGEDDADFFTDAGIVQAPMPYFEGLRSRCPVMREQHHGAIMVTGYDAAMEVLGQKGHIFSNCVSVAGPIPSLPFEPEGDDIRDQLDRHRDALPWSAHLVSFDGDRHAAHRALITRLLTHGRLKQNEAYLYGLADRLIDQFIARGGCEVVTEFAHPTSTLAIADLLGIPDEDRHELLDLLGAPPTSIEGDPEHKVGPDPLAFLEERFLGYIRERRNRPRDDLMSELVQSRFKDGSEPDDATLGRLARFTFGAGQDTSARLIAAAIRVLAEDAELQARLRRERDRIPDFIEEVLRIEAPTKVNFRLAQQSTTIADVPVPAGSVITVALLGANHDPAHFENPEIFDIDRPRLRDHLAFSRGGPCLSRCAARAAGSADRDRAFAGPHG